MYVFSCKFLYSIWLSSSCYTWINYAWPSNKLWSRQGVSWLTRNTSIHNVYSMPNVVLSNPKQCTSISPFKGRCHYTTTISKSTQCKPSVPLWPSSTQSSAHRDRSKRSKNILHLGKIYLNIHAISIFKYLYSISQVTLAFWEMVPCHDWIDLTDLLSTLPVSRKKKVKLQ